MQNHVRQIILAKHIRRESLQHLCRIDRPDFESDRLGGIHVQLFAAPVVPVEHRSAAHGLPEVGGDPYAQIACKGLSVEVVESFVLGSSGSVLTSRDVVVRSNDDRFVDVLRGVMQYLPSSIVLYPCPRRCDLQHPEW